MINNSPGKHEQGNGKEQHIVYLASAIRQQKHWIGARTIYYYCSCTEKSQGDRYTKHKEGNNGKKGYYQYHQFSPPFNIATLLIR